VTIETPENNERTLFLLKEEKAERPPRSLTFTEGNYTTNLCNTSGLTTTEESQTASLCNAHDLIT
jgi:hypothetical protein